MEERPGGDYQLMGAVGGGTMAALIVGFGVVTMGAIKGAETIGAASGALAVLPVALPAMVVAAVAGAVLGWNIEWVD